MEEETNNINSEDVSEEESSLEEMPESQSGEVYFHDRDRKAENNIGNRNIIFRIFHECNCFTCITRSKRWFKTST